MERMTKETRVVNPEKAPESYLTDIGQNGIFVHPKGDSTSGWRISDAIELLKSGVSWFKLWLDSNVMKLRLGRADSSHVTLDGSGMDVSDGTDSIASFGATARIGKAAGPRVTIESSGADIYGASNGSENLAHIGYASGNAQSGTDTAPYYTLGRRRPGSEIGNWSMAEGTAVIASGFASHAEGFGPTASGLFSHAEGMSSTASGEDSHSEGESTTASGHSSHAEGGNTTASNAYSHAEGANTVASGFYSHAQNDHTVAGGTSQTVIGRYNENDVSNAFEVGNGNENRRSNALALKWDGTLELATALPISSGGTGATSAADAWTALGGGSVGKKNSLSASDIPNIPTSKLNDGVLGTARGGTGTADFGNITDKVNVSSNKSISASTWTAADSFSLAAGTWLIISHTEWASASAGVRAHCVSPTSAAAAANSTSYATSPGGTAVRLTSMSFVSPTSETTYYLNVYQSHSAAINLTARRVRVMRIK